MWEKSVLDIRGSEEIQIQQCQMNYLGQGYFNFLSFSFTKSKVVYQSLFHFHWLYLLNPLGYNKDL